MDEISFWSRLQFGFTIAYHYLFPQLTMGLAPVLVWWKLLALRTGDARYRDAARCWSRIFGLTFVVGVVTGIPMEFQFGTNWSSFSRFAGGVIGQTLAMEGMIAFFLESACVGALVYGAQRMGERAHMLVALAVCLGSWLSGYFILVTNAFMQHPQGHAMTAAGVLALSDARAYLLNPWALVMYAHTMAAALVTGGAAIAAVGAFYALRGSFPGLSRVYLRTGTGVALFAALVVAYPTGDAQATMVARYQEVSLAAMEGHFHTGTMAYEAIIGQPDVAGRRIDNAIILPGALSYLATGSFHGEVRGLDAFPNDRWPDNIALLYYAFHIMVGLGTLLILVMALALLQRLRGRLDHDRRLLWALMLAWPFPYIATTAGWMTAELGRQPWLIFGVYRTAQGHSPLMHPGTVLFTLLGFLGLYAVVGGLYLVLIGREILRGSSPPPVTVPGGDAAPGPHA